MKKSPLSAAITAGVVGLVGLSALVQAQSVSTDRMYLNADGTGQVLIYPYYTVNGGNATLISVVNTTDEVKAVKVRFLEGRNSQEVLDFNLYLSPYDVWTGAVTDKGDPTGPGYLTTTDTSCTAPDIVGRENSEVAFRNFEYATLVGDDGPETLDRTREGYVEMIEMGEVVDNGDPDDLTVELNGSGVPLARTFATNATHQSDDGEPENCAAIRASWANNGVWDSINPDIDMLPPAGGLFGGGSIVDTAAGTNLTYNADAIDGFYRNQGSVGGYYITLHTDTGLTTPDLQSSANIAGGGTISEVFIGGQAVQMEFADDRGAAAVSALYMSKTLMNEFVTDPALGAKSEWVITFPTKENHIGETYQPPGSPFHHTWIQFTRPFTDWRDATGDGLVFDTTGSCENVSFARYDREEGPFSTEEEDLDFSPLPPGQVSATPTLCYEAQVVTINQPGVVEGGLPSGILGSAYARNLNLGVVDGWMAMTLGRDSLSDPDSGVLLGGTNSRGNYLPDGPLLQAPPSTPFTKDGVRLFGLPATGFWAMQVEVGAGNVANYGGLWRHRAGRVAGLYRETIADVGVVTNCFNIDPISGASIACRNIVTRVSTL